MYCHMLVFHSEHSLLSRMCFCCPGEHIFHPLTGTDTTVFSITPQTFICSCIIRKVYVKGHAYALIIDGLFSLSLCREDQTQPSESSSQTPAEIQHGLLHCTVSLSTVRSLAIDRTSPPTEPHFTSPATQSVHRDNNYEAWQLGMRLAVRVYMTEIHFYLDFTVCVCVCVCVSQGQGVLLTHTCTNTHRYTLI